MIGMRYSRRILLLFILTLIAAIACTEPSTDFFPVQTQSPTGSGRLLLLSGAPRHYADGALGDTLEAATVALFDPTGPTVVYDTIAIPATGVVEGISPIWAYLDGDGTREIIVIISDVAGGARVVTYNETGQLVAEVPDVGSGFRWRHQLVLAPFGPDDEIEIVVVLTPHIGGVVEFYRIREWDLDVVPRLPGLPSMSTARATWTWLWRGP